MPEHSNRLIHESSPYLRQHAHNPVDWYAWGNEAFARARAENKPILLSVGYSACHWCHVMERESFEDETTARLMNELFINIKVDREERPDVDHIYMSAVQMLTGHGGWPMTVFLTPEGKPFWGGTYFPPEDRHGMPGFKRILRGIAQAYHEKPEEVERTVGQLMDALKQSESVQASGPGVDAEAILTAAETLAGGFDRTNGGIGQAPKFPNEAIFDLFLRVHHSTGQRRFLDMTLHTLRQMAKGGIYDQLGGGFHRYSVDEKWLVPHFEKMLYDNAQLVPLYVAAYQISGDELFARIAGETLDYVMREMRSPEGGFYSTQDADSEGEEGKFFVWDKAEVQRVLGDDVADIVCRYWDITEPGNFEGHTILHPTLEIEQLAKLFRRDVGEVRSLLADAREKLFQLREQRVKPHRDEKILTAWNGLMISAFAKTAEAVGDNRYADVAVRAVDFIEAKLLRGDRLLSTYKDGVARLNGYLDDYVFFIAALLDVFELTQATRFLDRARQLMDITVAHFWDSSSAGFFFTSDDHETLIVRSKPSFDGSIPSGNSVAARNLLRLYHYTERSDYHDRAEAMLRLLAGAMRQQPFGFANLFCTADLDVRKPKEIVLVARPGEGDELLARIHRTYLPNRSLRIVSPTSPESLPALLEGKGQIGNKPTVYVCHNMTCTAPVTDRAGLERELRS